MKAILRLETIVFPFVVKAARAVATVILALGLILTSSSAFAAPDWKPKGVITIVVPAGPGGGSDQFVRQIIRAAEEIEPGIKFVIQNIAAGGGAAGFTTYMGMNPDGQAFISVFPEIAQKLSDGSLPFSADDVVPVMRAQNGPATVLAKGGEPRFKNYDEMIAYMKKTGKELIVAVFTEKGFDDLTLMAIEEKEGVKFKRVPYVKAGERFASLMGGHVDLLTQRVGDVMNLIKGGKMWPVIFDIPNRMAEFPQTPTFKDKGINFKLGYWRGIWAKKGTPAEAVEYLDKLLHRAMSHPTYKAYEEENYYNLVPGYLDRKEFAKDVAQEIHIYRSAYGIGK